MREVSNAEVVRPRNRTIRGLVSGVVVVGVLTAGAALDRYVLPHPRPAISNQIDNANTDAKSLCNSQAQAAIDKEFPTDIGHPVTPQQLQKAGQALINRATQGESLRHTTFLDCYNHHFVVHVQAAEEQVTSTTQG